jgi:hypothetical protein
MILSCGSKRLSPEVLQHKLDSIKAVEIKERLALQGIDLTKSDNPLKQFYDSLNLQPLPLSYSEDYVRFLPDFKDIPAEIVSMLEFEGEHPKAITLPESLSARLLVVASDEYDNLYSIWLYSLDDDYVPVDKLCLYAIEDQDPEEYDEIGKEEFIQYFSITSDYQIHLIDFSKTKNKTRLEEVYDIDVSRKFVLEKSELD